MKKIFFLLLFCGLFLGLKSQTKQGRWTDLFSYNNVLEIGESDGKIIAATENGIFYYNTISGEITKLSKANGLHDVKISAFDYNPVTKIALVGYQSGGLDIITSEGITYIVDIPLAQGYSASKKINHISINGDLAVISVGYGISIFNLAKKEFADSTFFFNGGVYESSNQAVIKDNKVYSVTNTGLKSHDINVSLPVFSTWTVHVLGNFQKIDSEGIIAFANTNTVQYGNIGSFGTIAKTFTNIKNLRVTATNIIVTDDTKVYVFNLTGNLLKTFDAQEQLNSAIIVNNQLYTGTKFSGIFNESKEIFKPDGPYSNVSYKISLLNDQIWVSSGGRDAYSYNFSKDLGYYHFDGTKWNYPNYFINNPIMFNILDVVPNPAKPTEVFFTNYQFLNNKGIYKMENNEFVKLYNQGGPYDNLPVGLSFDENNQLFCSVGFIDFAAGKIGYYLYDSQTDNFTLFPIIKSGQVQKPITKDGFLYIPSPFGGDGGFLIYNYNHTPANTSDDQSKIIRQENGLQVNGTVCAAIDKNDDAWIGTRAGLRVLANPKNAVTETKPIAEPIIIVQNGIPEELFKDLTILQIEVDSGNQKWVSIDGGGVFYLNSNGEKTLQNFTKSNSPLPTDSVTDIKVDSKTGKVYFVTLGGIVVYQGDAVDVSSNFGDVLVYPNPVIYSQYKGNVKIRGLAEKTNIRITDTTGNLVHQAVSKGGYYEWNLNNQRGNRVASGIYYVLMTNEDGTDKATAKIAVVN